MTDEDRSMLTETVKPTVEALQRRLGRDMPSRHA